SGLNVRFVSRDATVHAVNGIDFAVHDGEVLCILGESGSGKTVSLRALLRLLPRHARIDGSVRVAGEEVLTMPARALRDLRGGKVAMVFQEPMTALDPVYTVGQQIGEAVRRHTGCGRAAARARAFELLELVRIPSPERRLKTPAHPYTAGLLASTVHGQPRERDIDAIPGSPPDLRRLPPGCSFAPRCPRRIADCRRAVPEPRLIATGRMAACFAVAEA